MTQKEFLVELKKSYENNIKISERKNSDYATSDDAFKNFKACEMIGVPAAVGILVRMTDKLIRVSNLLNQPAKVNDEKITDTLSDLANYAMILKVYLDDRGEV